MIALACAWICSLSSPALQEDSERNVFAGHVAGLPAGVELRASIHTWGGWSGEALNSCSVELDEDGAFRCEYAAEWSLRSDFSGRIVLWTAGSPRLAAMTSWSGRLLGGVHELGTLALLPVPVLVSGTIEGGGELAPTEFRVSLELVESRRAAAGRHWVAAPALICACDAAGRFEVRGLVGPEVRRLRLAFREWPAAEVVVGQRDVRIEVPEAGRVCGRLQVAEGLAHAVRAELEPLSREGLRRSINLTPGDLFSLRVPPGRYRLLATVRGDEPLVLHESVQVVAGETLELDDIDLRGRIRRVTVTVADRHGRPLEPTLFPRLWRSLPAARGSDRLGTPEYFRDGRCEFAATSPVVDLRVAADGYGTVELTAFGDAIAVTLPEPYSIDVRLPEELVRLAPKARVELMLEVEPGRTACVDGLFVRAGDRLHFELSEAGVYSGGLILRDPRDPRHAAGSCGRGTATLRVRQYGGRQELCVEVADAVLEQIRATW